MILDVNVCEVGEDVVIGDFVEVVWNWVCLRKGGDVESRRWLI